MPSKVTYKNIYTLLSEEIDRKIGFNPKASFSNQQSRTAIAPLSMTATSAVSNATTAELVTSIQNILAASLPSTILSGLKVEATDPATDWITVSTGKGVAGGNVYELETETTVRVPLNLNNTVYICLWKDGIHMESSPVPDMVTLAKIIIPNIGFSNIIRDKRDPDLPLDPYIQCFNEFKLYGINNQLEEDGVELLRDNIGEILADNLIGNLRLSENLKITNSQGTLELNSDSLKLFDINASVLSKFNRDGVFFYNSDGVELAKFTGTEARVGNIIIGTNSIYSGNFVSGNLGAGFRIGDDGNAEFNNVLIRGKFKTAVFEKDTISAVGGNLLVIDADILDVDMTALDASTLKISGDTTFSVNDVLRIKDGVDDEWFTVTNAGSAPIYTVTRDRAGSYSADTNPIWTKGTAVVNYGASGDGGIYFTSSEANSPYMSIFKHSGSPWSSTDTVLRVGNLNGFLGYSSDLYGIAIGTTDDYLKYDPVGGLQIKGSITITGGDIPSKTFYQDDEPGSGDDINEGDYWVDTNDSNKLYIYESAAWVLIADSAGGAGGITSFAQDAIPTSLAEGDLWMDTNDSNKLYRAASEGADEITGGEWVLVQDTGAAAAGIGLDSGGNLVSSASPACNVGTPSGAGLYLGADYMGYYGGSAWCNYMDNSGNFYFTGDGSNYMSWNGTCLELRGCLNADDIQTGTLLGQCIKTASSGARIEMNTTCFSAYDSSNNETFKISMGGPDAGSTYMGDISGGNYAQYDTINNTFNFYNESAEVSGQDVCCVRICNGNLLANSMCLVNPNCAECYSFFDSGQWYFSDGISCSPYVKRICSGTGCTGDTVILQYWQNAPEIQVGIKSLMAYDATYSNQDQQWNVYHDAPQYYYESGNNYGYCFDIHADLALAASTGGECIKNIAFGACTTTDANVCQTCVRTDYQLWCNAACANYYYGCLCYDVCYRINGSGTWCSCSFTYTQAHANVPEMKTDCSICVTMNFPSGQTWELMACQTGLNWVDSGFDSESITCYLCQRSVTPGSTNHSWSVSCTCNGTCGNWNHCRKCTTSLSVAGSTPANSYCTVLQYQVCDYGSCSCVCAYHQLHVAGWACTRGCLETDFGVCIYRGNSALVNMPDATVYCCCSACANFGASSSDGLNVYGAAGCSFNSFTLVSCFKGYARQCSSGFTCWSHTYSNQTCFQSGTLCHCYCCVSGASGSSTVKCFYSVTDTYASQVILDPSGCLNWVAIAYT